MDNAPGVRFVSLTFLIGFGFGAFIGVGLALIAVAITRPEDEEPRVIEVPIIATATATLEPEATPETPVRATSAVAVRVGPGDQFATVGTVTRGDALDVVGRDFESEWLAIRFPAGSNSQGWIPAAGVEGLTFSSLQALAVVLPTPLPLQPTLPPTFLGTPGTPGTGTPGVDEGTPDPLAGTVDLAIADVSALPSGSIRISVINGGPADLESAILTVQVRTFDGRFQTFHYTEGLVVGATLTLTTSTFTLDAAPEEVQVLVDPSSTLDDPDRSNNVTTVVLSRPEVTPTPAASS
jgi:hypothetical protein